MSSVESEGGKSKTSLEISQQQTHSAEKQQLLSTWHHQQAAQHHRHHRQAPWQYHGPRRHPNLHWLRRRVLHHCCRGLWMSVVLRLFETASNIFMIMIWPIYHEYLSSWNYCLLKSIFGKNMFTGGKNTRMHPLSPHPDKWCDSISSSVR